jgi:hypothetical protein
MCPCLPLTILTVFFLLVVAHAPRNITRRMPSINELDEDAFGFEGPHSGEEVEWLPPLSCPEMTFL